MIEKIDCPKYEERPIIIGNQNTAETKKHTVNLIRDMFNTPAEK